MYVMALFMPIKYIYKRQCIKTVNYSCTTYVFIFHTQCLIQIFCRFITDLTSIVSPNRQQAVHVSVQPPASVYFASIDPTMSDTSSVMGSISNAARQSGQHQFQDTFPGSVDLSPIPKLITCTYNLNYCIAFFPLNLRIGLCAS